MSRHPAQRRITLSFAAAAAVLAIAVPALAANAAQAKDKPALEAALAELDAAIARGVAFLRTRQNADGGYGSTQGRPALQGASDFGMTAFALHALAQAPSAVRDLDDPSVKRALSFVLERQQADGSFTDPREPALLEYKTSVVILALTSLGRDAHSGAIDKATAFLKSRQFSEDLGFEKDNPYYHGFGYDPRPGGAANLSVTKYVLEALYAAGVSSGDSVWENVRGYLSRTQNAPEVDPILAKHKIGTTGDWGFRYGPDDTRGVESTAADGTRTFSSYGSMTYAGLLSFLYARVDKSDPRVAGAFRWISDNFTVEVNPGRTVPGAPEKSYEGLYYYYHTMAKALSVYGEPIVVDRQGVRHDWAVELGRKLVSVQKDKGHWSNDKAARWLESVPELATCYAVIAMTTCREDIAARLAKTTPTEKEKR